jgi:hypothetical protein
MGLAAMHITADAACSTGHVTAGAFPAATCFTSTKGTAGTCDHQQLLSCHNGGASHPWQGLSSVCQHNSPLLAFVLASVLTLLLLLLLLLLMVRRYLRRT